MKPVKECRIDANIQLILDRTITDEDLLRIVELGVEEFFFKYRISDVKCKAAVKKFKAS